MIRIDRRRWKLRIYRQPLGKMLVVKLITSLWERTLILQLPFVYRRDELLEPEPDIEF